MTIDFEPFLSPRRGARSAQTLSAEEAVRRIPDGSRVYVEGGSMTPLALLEALDDERARWTRLELAAPYLMARPAPFEHPGDPFWFVTTQASPAYKHLWGTGTVSVLPAKYSDTSLIFRPDGDHSAGQRGWFRDVVGFEFKWLVAHVDGTLGTRRYHATRSALAMSSTAPFA